MFKHKVNEQFVWWGKINDFLNGTTSFHRPQCLLGKHLESSILFKKEEYQLDKGG